MTTDPALELAARMPWLHAQPDTWWLITTDDDANCIDCVARVLDHDVYDTAHPWFAVPLDSGTHHVPAAHVTRARELLLVRADAPLTAAYPWDQDAIDAALARRDEETHDAR